MPTKSVARTLLLSFGLAIVLALGIAGIAGLASSWHQREPQAHRARATVVDNSPYVTRERFEAEGLKWPLTVEGGMVGCTGLAAWFQAPDGTVYGVNGFATQAQGYADITPIWLEDERANEAWRRQTGAAPEHPLKINISDLLNRANALCEDAPS
jgi:hypothetical protein